MELLELGVLGTELAVDLRLAPGALRATIAQACRGIRHATILKLARKLRLPAMLGLSDGPNHI